MMKYAEVLGKPATRVGIASLASVAIASAVLCIFYWIGSASDPEPPISQESFVVSLNKLVGPQVENRESSELLTYPVDSELAELIESKVVEVRNLEMDVSWNHECQRFELIENPERDHFMDSVRSGMKWN